MLSCFDIATYFIWLANEKGSFLSNLKLQKLVYYAQAWHLALNEEPVFSNADEVFYIVWLDSEHLLYPGKG